jgi:putative FmdB family regulatory protein
MPIYEYRCGRGHTFEVLQRMSDDPVTVCTSCDAQVQRVLHPVAVHFKGSGFYTTDYARKAQSGGDSTGRDSSDTGKNGSEKSGSTSTKAEKPDSSKATSSSSKSESSD